MKIDRYTKVVLTIIAVGIIGLNVHFFKDDFIKEAHAYVDYHNHDTYEIYGLESFVYDIASQNANHSHDHYDIHSFKSRVQNIVENCLSQGEDRYIWC